MSTSFEVPPGAVADRLRVLAATALLNYSRHSPVRKGRAFALRSIPRILPPSGFRHRLPGGASVRLRYREVIGQHVFLNGSFEAAETAAAMNAAGRGTVAFDVGANIGVYTLPLATAVGPNGAVVAFEPFPENIARLSRHVSDARLANVRIVPAAAWTRDGEVEIERAADPAYHSVVAVKSGLGSGERSAVPARSLDSVWIELGRPRVTLVKVDVEGGEASVLAGAAAMIAECKPVVLAEADDEHALRRVLTALSVPYRAGKPPGFEAWNWLLTPAGS